MVRGSIAGAVVLAAGSSVSFGNLGPILVILGALGGVGAAVAAVAAIYKARSEKGLSDAQKLEILFERQREINVDLIALKDEQIKDLQDRLASANGQRDDIRERLEDCQRERLVLENQVQGLEATLATLRHKEPPDA